MNPTAHDDRLFHGVGHRRLGVARLGDGDLRPPLLRHRHQRDEAVALLEERCGRGDFPWASYLRGAERLLDLGERAAARSVLERTLREPPATAGPQLDKRAQLWARVGDATRAEADRVEQARQRSGGGR